MDMLERCQVSKPLAVVLKYVHCATSPKLASSAPWVEEKRS